MSKSFSHPMQCASPELVYSRAAVMDGPACFTFLELPAACRRGTHPAEPSEWVKAHTAACHEFYGAPGTVMLASTTPRPMTYWLMPNERRALWTAAHSPRSALQFFYMIEAGRPVTLYCDFDAPGHVYSTAAEFRDAVLLCCSYLARFLDALYGCRLHRRHYDGRWRLFEANVAAGPARAAKWSMHVHTRLVFEDVHVLNGVMQRFVALLRSGLRTVDPRLRRLFYSRRGVADECVMDDRVYNARPFRLPLNRKSGALNNFLRPLEPDARPEDTVRWGFVHPPEPLAVPPLGCPPEPWPSAAAPVAGLGALGELVHGIVARVCAAAGAAGLVPPHAPTPRLTSERQDRELERMAAGAPRVFAPAVAFHVRQHLQERGTPPDIALRVRVARLGLDWCAAPYAERVQMAAAAAGLATAAAPEAGTPLEPDAAPIDLKELFAACLLVGTRFEPDAALDDAAACRALADYVRLEGAPCSVAEGDLADLRAGLQQHALCSVRQIGMVNFFPLHHFAPPAAETFVFAPHAQQPQQQK